MPGVGESELGLTIANRYRLNAVLGAGAMGVVYRATQLDTDGQEVREVALKMIKADLAAKLPAEAAQRFTREIHTAAQLRCPSCVMVFDFGRAESGSLFYVMEFVQGPTLKDVLRQQGALPTETALEIGRQICEALQAAHALPRPAVHRDLKPANVFIERWPEHVWVRVVDFGVAKILDTGDGTELTQTGEIVGTPRYMSPEQCQAEAVDPRADLYSLGVLLYEMLSGSAPFSGNPVDIMYQHVHTPAPPLADSVPSAVRNLVANLLAKKAADRPPNATAVYQQLVTASESDIPQMAARDTQRRTANSAPSGTANIANDVLIGKVLNGKYRLTSVVGRGTLGVVYRASQLDPSGDTVRDVAVKVLRQDLGRWGGEELAHNFSATVKIAAQLCGPHVLTVHDFGRAETGHLYDVMQLVDGVPLKRVLEQQGALPLPLTASIGAQLCEALQEMHSIPVAHLALRPSAILLERWPRHAWVRMREAGLVKILGCTGNHLLVGGVPPYRAPELWAGKDAGSGAAADLYSLGAILYEMLTGAPPFRGDLIGLMYRHLHEPPPPLPTTVPQPLRDIVTQLLAKEPTQRPSSPEVVGQVLAQFTSKQGTEPSMTLAEATTQTVLPHRPL